MRYCVSVTDEARHPPQFRHYTVTAEDHQVSPLSGTPFVPQARFGLVQSSLVASFHASAGGQGHWRQSDVCVEVDAVTVPGALPPSRARELAGHDPRRLPHAAMYIVRVT